ncbi:MAG: 1,4-dihydroxy-2-naphthoate polyprenyltransferase, partial [Chthoniobacterales bacterium]|nr:1,4-dihydroxy-2-naphthoate polyprenyltransferase [Chthoniobacterales bacterium]
MNPWILAARPRTLGAAVIPVLAGCATAFSAGSFDPLTSAFILACAVLIQIATNYFNDAIDHAKGADTAERIGPVRVTSSGLLLPRSVMTAGAVCLFLAAVLALPLVLRGGWPVLLLGVFSLFFAYAYTGGPFPLAYLGLGEIFVVLFFGVFAVAGTFYLSTLEFSGPAVLAGLQIGLHASVLLTVNNLRDLKGDRAAGKRTLAARFGLTFARRENAALVLAPFVLGLTWLPLGYLWAFLLPLMTLPLAWWLARACLAAQPDRSVNQLLAHGAALHA